VVSALLPERTLLTMRLSLHTLITRPSPVDFDIHRVGVPGQRNLTNTRLQFESSVVQVPFKSNASAEKLNTKQAQTVFPQLIWAPALSSFFYAVASLPPLAVAAKHSRLRRLEVRALCPSKANTNIPASNFDFCFTAESRHRPR